jgi:hypothetical protein
MIRHPYLIEALWALIVRFIGLLIIFYGIGVFGYQVIGWLRDGFWTPFELRTEWEWLWAVVGMRAPQPQFSWLGIQKIVSWLLQAPLSLAIIIQGIAVYGFGRSLKAKVDVQIAEFKRVAGTS